jgi:predicted permease
MQNIILVLLPIFLLICLGYVFKRFAFPHEDFWAMADKFTYYVLFPSLLVYKLTTANLGGINSFTMLIVAAAALVVMFILTLFMKRFKAIDNSAFTSVIQGSIRFNTYVFLALVDAIFGDSGLVIAAILIAFAIIFINFLCIASFAYFVPQQKFSVINMFKTTLKNPLIVACLIGILLNLAPIEVPVVLLNTVSILSQAALPLGLLSVGVGLQLTHMAQAKYPLFLATFLKLLIFPLVMFLLAKWFDLPLMQQYILLLFACMPTASSSFILARQLGGDLKLMSSIITVQTLLCIVTLSFVIAFISP